MKTLKIEENLYLVEYKYKNLLKIGYELQGKTITKIEEKEYLSKDHVIIITKKYNNHL